MGNRLGKHYPKSGKVPQAGPTFVVSALPKENDSLSFNDNRRFAQFFDRCLLPYRRNAMLQTHFACWAKRRQRTHRAFGISRRANHTPQLHQSLIQFAAAAFR